LEEERGEHLLHALDLGGLIGVDAGGEPVHGLLLPRARAERALVTALCTVPREELEKRWARPSRERK